MAEHDSDEEVWAALEQFAKRIGLDKPAGKETAIKQALRTLQDANSSFEATKEFLASRGKTNIKELDKREIMELKKYLEGKLKQALAGKFPRTGNNSGN